MTYNTRTIDVRRGVLMIYMLYYVQKRHVRVRRYALRYRFGDWTFFNDSITTYSGSTKGVGGGQETRTMSTRPRETGAYKENPSFVAHPIAEPT